MVCELEKSINLFNFSTYSRLFRVLTKLCTVVDRAELNGDFSWSEYGDCYMLKLFRDYVFHQVGFLHLIDLESLKIKFALTFGSSLKDFLKEM